MITAEQARQLEDMGLHKIDERISELIMYAILAGKKEYYRSGQAINNNQVNELLENGFKVEWKEDLWEYKITWS